MSGTRTNRGQRTRGERGFAFVMALLVAMLVAGIATTIAVVSATESRISANYIESKQTLYLAEAGIQHGLWQLSKDPTNRTPLVAQGLEGDKYDVIMSVVGYGLYDIAARGRSSTAAGTGIYVRASVFPQTFNYALVTGDYQDKSLSANIQGAVGGGEVPAPQIEFAALQAMADWYIPNDVTFYNDFFYSGTIYVRGDIKFTDNVWLEGTIIAEGKIEFEGYEGDDAHFASQPGMPALVAGDNILLGRHDAWGQISIRGAVVSMHDILLERWNHLYVDGSLVGDHKIEFHRDCSDITVKWNPTLRLEPPFGISQSGGTYAWTTLPDTWATLTDLTPFEAL